MELYFGARNKQQRAGLFTKLITSLQSEKVFEDIANHFNPALPPRIKFEGGKIYLKALGVQGDLRVIGHLQVPSDEHKEKVGNVSSPPFAKIAGLGLLSYFDLVRRKI